MNKVTIGVVAVIVVVGGWLLLSGDKTPQETGPIKVGFIAPLTGDAASYGEPARIIAEIAAARLNEEGGANGREVEVIFEDGKCSGKDATSAAQKLINIDHVHVITGLICSGEAQPVVPIGDTGNTFMLSVGASSPDLSGVSKNFARLIPSDASQASALASMITSRGYTKVALINEATDYAQAVAEAFISNFEGEIVHETFTSNAQDVRTQITKLQSSGAEVVFIAVQTPASAEKVLAQIQSSSWRPLVVPDIVIALDQGVVTKYSSLFQGSFAPKLSLTEDNDHLEYLRSQYEERTGTREIPFEAFMYAAYDGLFLISEAFEKTDGSTEALSDWFYGLRDWDGGIGITTINELGDREGGYTITNFENGSFSN